MSIAAKITRAGFLPLAMLAGCRDAPATVPDVLLWAHERDEVVSMPVVVDLDGDGVSEVLINTTRQTGPGSDLAVGELVCLDGATGAEVWRVAEDPARQQFGSHGRSTLAVGDVSGDGKPDIIYAGRPVGSEGESLVHAVDGAGRSVTEQDHWAQPGKLGFRKGPTS